MVLSLMGSNSDERLTPVREWEAPSLLPLPLVWYVVAYLHAGLR